MRKTRTVDIGGVLIGGDNAVAIQSMTTTDTRNIRDTLEQINSLYKAGCDIVRLAVLNKEAAESLKEICSKSPIPVVADIHFDYNLALISAASGVSKIRINPGNIGGEDRVEAVVKACLARSIPIRIGVNSGSVHKDLLDKYGGPTAEALVESALYNVGLLNKFGFEDIVISLKSSNVSTMMQSYMLMAEKCDYPLHLGVTEAGTERMGTIKSSAGIGGLLALGIGDTIRVSLTADPLLEIPVAKDILKAVGLNKDGVTLISCPTCGRCQIDLIGIANEVQTRVADIDKKITVAVMGCAVNGPGEAREADIGIAGGNGEGILFRHGEIIRKVPEDKLIDALMEEINSEQC